MASRASQNRWLLAAGLVALGLVGLVVVLLLARRDADPPPPTLEDEELAERAEALVRGACTPCHAFPEPEILPEEVWPGTVARMYALAEEEGVEMPLPPHQAAGWYTHFAPEELPEAQGRTDAGPGPVGWAAQDWRPDLEVPPEEAPPGVTHVEFFDLLDGPGEDLLVSDAPGDRVYALPSGRAPVEALVLGEVRDPARMTVTDLDGDGRRDVVVAALGRMRPTNERVGSVVWLRRTGPESFEPVVLLDDVGRVADVKAADVTGNGRHDLVVAVFGWRENGKVLLMENVGGDGEGPEFIHHVLDDRAGFTDVRIADLNGDGHLDVVGLATQEWQEVMVYWGENGDFRPETIWSAPHPDWGFVGLEVVDFTGSGLPDIVVTNGDNLDVTVPKPHHGVGLLENTGDGGFTYHHLTHMYGAHRAEPVDLTGDGRPGLLVAAYLPPGLTRDPPGPPEAVLWLERVGPTQLVRRVLHRAEPRHMTLGAGDATGGGLTDFAVGWMDLGFADPAQAAPGPLEPWVSLWRQEAPADGPTPLDDVAPDEVIDWSDGS